jgi:hypothetical protein
MTQLPMPKGCNWFLTSASFSKFSDKDPVQKMFIFLKTVTFSNKNFTSWISASSPQKSEIAHNLREHLKQQGNESDVQSSSSKDK